MNEEKIGQVWIETVIYIMIGLTLIALVLAFVIPKTNQQKDNAIIEQAINSLNDVDEKVIEVIDNGPGNKRMRDFNLKAGKISLYSDKDEMVYQIDEIEQPYSEPNIKIPMGRIIVESTILAKKNRVSLTLSYNNMANLTFNKGILNPSSMPYSFTIENFGLPVGSSLYNIRVNIK